MLSVSSNKHIMLMIKTGNTTTGLVLTYFSQLELCAAKTTKCQRVYTSLYLQNRLVVAHRSFTTHGYTTCTGITKSYHINTHSITNTN